MTKKVTFELPAEIVGNATEGILLGDFNNWNHDEAVKLHRKSDGSMYAVISLIAGRSYQYRYMLNDGRWVNDKNPIIINEVYGQTVENCLVDVQLEEKKKAEPKKAAVPKKDAAPKKEASSTKTAVPKKVAAPKKAAAPKKTGESKK